LSSVSMAKRGRIEYVLSLEPLCVHAAALRAAAGAIVNIENRHWVALRWEQGVVWLLDSMEERPRALTWTAYQHFVRLHRGAFRIDLAPPSA
jgi:hypothetical protein